MIDDRFIRIGEVCERTSMSKSKIYAMVKAGEFPAQSSGRGVAAVRGGCLDGSACGSGVAAVSPSPFPGTSLKGVPPARPRRREIIDLLRDIAARPEDA